MADTKALRAFVRKGVSVRLAPAALFMTLPTHMLAGLIIGNISGDFPAALAGSLFIDIDHVISYTRHGILFKPKELFHAISDKADPWGDQRNFLHSIFSWVILSLILFIVHSRFGFVFSIAYFIHLTLDALDSSDFYPFFPFKKFVLKGLTEYYSKQELTFDVGLLLIFVGLSVFRA